jgi:hypothetical protein
MPPRIVPFLKWNASRFPFCIQLLTSAVAGIAGFLHAQGMHKRGMDRQFSPAESA